MSMITMTGQLINTYSQQSTFDGQTTEKPRIQVLGDVVQKNGAVKKDLVTITVHDLARYESKVGEAVSVPVGVFSPAKGQVVFYAV